MSRKFLVLTLLVALLLTTSVSPRVTQPLNEHTQTAGETAWPTQISTWLGSSIRFEPNGGCEDGGASGCPSPG